MSKTRIIHICVLAASTLGLAACNRADNFADDLADLHTFIAEVKSRPGAAVEPLPEPTHYEEFSYDVIAVRSPFVPPTDMTNDANTTPQANATVDANAAALAELQSAQAQTPPPLHTEFIQVNYADASDIVKLLDNSGSGSADSTNADISTAPESDSNDDTTISGILSSRGSARVDERTNIIIVRDTANKLQEIQALITRLDIPVRQVLIEARIVNVSTEYDRDLGIRWGGAGTDGNFRYGGSLEATVEQSANQAAQQLALQNVMDGVPIPQGSVTFPAALAVDLGVNSPDASRFSIGYTGGSGLIELELSALESSGNGEVIARPKVATQDKVTALIQSGVRIPYQSQAGGTAGGSTTEFEEALLSLEVTPQITPDGRINMQLDIRQDSVVARSGIVPAINTNQVKTSALVNDGDTIVLGGVFREEITATESKTPLLGDIPYLGRLFKRTENTSRRTELLIFITPNIITDSNGR
ncbi:MAG: pilus assembly protein PilP [Pseudohongiellaceae bacterium]